MTASSSPIFIYIGYVSLVNTIATIFNDIKRVLQTRNHCNENHFSAFLVPKTRHGIKERLNDVIVKIMSLKNNALSSGWVIN